MVPYHKASAKIQARLRELLETYRSQSKESVNLAHQEFDFVLNVDVETKEVQPFRFKNRQADKALELQRRENHRDRDDIYFLPPLDTSKSSFEAKSGMSRFNRGFLRSFEPLLFYQNDYKSFYQEGNNAGRVETRLPLWLAVLEVEEGKLNYSTFAVGKNQKNEQNDAYGLDRPLRVAEAHDIYDAVQDEKEMIDLSHLYTVKKNDVSYLPAAIVFDDEDESYDRWRKECRQGYDLELNTVELKRKLVDEIDARLRVENIKEKNSRKERREKIKTVRNQLWRKHADSEVEFDLDSLIFFREPERWIEEAWRSKSGDQEDRKRGMLFYFVWLRSIAITAGDSTNFKVYLYFPNPDISGEYVHTVSSAFADWPDPEWMTLVERSVPKLFQRSALLLAKRESLRNARIISHETTHVVGALSGAWLISPQNLGETDARGDPLVTVDQIEELANWKIVPFPELIDDVRKMFRLWSQTNKPSDIFAYPPKSVEALVEECWSLAKCILTPYSVSDLSLEKRDSLKEVMERLDYISNKIASPSVRIKGRYQPPDPFFDTRIDARTTGCWMQLVRLLTAIMGNCLRHGHHDERTDVTFWCQDSRLIIEVNNSSMTVMEKEKQQTWLRNAAEDAPTSFMVSDLSGKQIIRLYAESLQAKVQFTDDDIAVGDEYNSFSTIVRGIPVGLLTKG